MPGVSVALAMAARDEDNRASGVSGLLNIGLQP